MSGPSTSTLELLYNMAEQNLQATVDEVRELDEKASQLLRLNVLVLGILVSGLSVTFHNLLNVEVAKSGFLQVVGVASMFIALSTVLSGLAYLRKETIRGISDLSPLLSLGMSKESLRKVLVESMEEAAEENKRVLRGSSIRFQAAIAVLLMGIVLVAGVGVTLLLLSNNTGVLWA